MKTDQTLEEQETLDGTTAGFIAAIANALNRSIGHERMKELIADNDKLKRLLSVLIHDDVMATFPFLAMSYATGTSHLCQTVHICPNAKTGDMEPTMRNLMAEVYDRKLAPHSEEDALRLADALVSAQWSRRQKWAIPFVRRKKLRMYLHEQIGANEVKDVGVDLDKVDCEILFIPLFLKLGWHDRSDCFQ